MYTAYLLEEIPDLPLSWAVFSVHVPAVVAAEVAVGPFALGPESVTARPVLVLQPAFCGSFGGGGVAHFADLQAAGHQSLDWLTVFPRGHPLLWDLSEAAKASGPVRLLHTFLALSG